jgi:hypothetical protein
MGKDRDLEIVELDDERDEDAFTPGRLITVAALGAAAALGLYYMYQQLDEEKRTSIRRKASGLVADQIHRLTDVDHEHEDQE